MPILKYEELTWIEINNLDREKTIFFIPMAPLEEHSHYLPVGVDYFNSLFFCNNAGTKFLERNPEYNVVIYPALAIGSDCFRFPGTIDVSQKGIYLVAKSMGKALCVHGFKNIMFIGLHGGPRHITALEQACRSLNRKYKANLLAPFGSVLTNLFMKQKFAEDALNRKLDDDEWYKLERDLHAGYVETSLMLLHHPELVKPHYKNAKSFPVRLLDMRRHPSQFKDWEGQLGYPSLSSKEVGETLSENLTNWFVELLLKWLNGEDMKMYKRSLVSKLLIFNVNFKKWLTFFSLIITAAILFLIFY